MKRIYSFMFAAVAVFAAASCAQELDNAQLSEAEVVTFEASVDGADTKVTLEGKVSKWENGDKITIHNGTTGYEFSTADSGTKANFSYAGNDFTGEKFMAVYPAGTYNANVDAKAVTVNIPTNQPSRENDFSMGAVPSVAYSETQSLSFKNAATLLKFTVKGTNVKEVVFYGHNNEAVSGDVLVTLNDDNTIKSIVPQETTVTENEVTETKYITWAKVWAQTEDWCFNEGVTYYLAVVPQNFEKGFTVQLNIDGVGTKDIKKLETAYELKPNTIVDLGELEYVAPVAHDWAVAGSFNGWDVSANPMSLEDGFYVIRNVTGLAYTAKEEGTESATGFKFIQKGEWRGSGDGKKTVGTWDYVWGSDGMNIYVDGADAETAYDIYVNPNEGDYGKFVIVAAGSPMPEENPSEDPSEEPVASDYGVVGSFQTPTTWDVVNPVAMKSVSGGWIVAENVELYKSDEFKFVKGNTWDVSYGTSSVTVLENGVETAVVDGGQNMKVSKNGKYNLYLNPADKKVKVECVEVYTDLTVDITIDNKANWSPLTISLWDGDTEIVSNASVTDNKYSVSGDYIGSSLTCQLASGSKTSEKMSVSITKTGATVTLEETVVKLYFQLNTANAKQWWGNTSKIHVWNTGTSFDTSWPGTTMTSEGNYTWSIIVPSELVGKTINYLVHNGNGWQSKDSTVTIKAEGVTVTGSSIGVN